MISAQDGDIYRAATEAGVPVDEIVDFSGNISPCAVPDAVREALARSADLLNRYPDACAAALRAAAAPVYGVKPENILAGADTTEFIYAVPRGLRPRRAVISAPGTPHYWRACDQCGAEAEGILAPEEADFVPDMTQIEHHLGGADLLFIGHPADPTGLCADAEALRRLAGLFPSAIFVADETHMDFVPESMTTSLLSAALPPNILVLRSLSPCGLAGLRVGFCIGAPDLLGLVERVREPWTLNVPAQLAAEALLTGPRDLAALRAPVIAERERLRDEIGHLPGLRVFRSQANFLLLKITKPNLTSAMLCDRLLRQNCLVRNASGYRGLNGKFIRLSARTVPENDRLLVALRMALDDARWK